MQCHDRLCHKNPDSGVGLCHPRAMLAITISRPGGPEVLEMREVEDAVAGSAQIVVSVAATGLNRADLLQRRGLYPAPPEAPASIPGLEFSGTIHALGAGVTELRVGEPVMGIVGGGAYAQRVAAPAAQCMRLPARLDPVEAAAVPEAFVTAFDALFSQAALVANETVLINAAGSGVGTAALQLAAAVGARTVATARSPAKLARLADWGASVVVDASDDEWPGRVRRETEDGVDVVLDLVGGAGLPAHVDLLRPGGRLVTLGLLGGRRGELDLLAVMQKRLRLTGSTLRGRSPAEKARAVAAFAGQGLRWLESGLIRPCVDRVLPWTEAPAAHATMERNANFGKIVLAVT